MRSLRAVLVGTLTLAVGALALPAAGVAFSGNPCTIPTPAQLAAAGVTGTCTKATKSIPNGSVITHKYTAHWSTPPSATQTPSALSIQITKFTGPKSKLAKLEAFEREQIGGHLGGQELGGKVKVGNEPASIAKGTELLFITGHLFVVLVRFDKPPVEGVIETPADKTASVNDMIAFGKATLAAL
jgi:hypothetical protein